MRGFVQKIVGPKNYLWIRTVANGVNTDYFAHRSALRGGLVLERMSVGQHVEFVPDPHGPRGPRAEDVRPMPVTTPVNV